MAKVEKIANGKKFNYLCNGKLFRTSTREYKYACIATTRISKGAGIEGLERIISLGNNPVSTYNSYARFYKHCDLEVVEI